MKLAWLALLGCVACDVGKGGVVHDPDTRPDGRMTLDAFAADAIDAAIDATAAITLTQTSSQALVKDASAACINSGSYTEENEWYRVFDLPSFGIVDTFHVEQVTFAVDTSNGGKMVTVKIGSYAGTPGSSLNTGNADFAGLVTPISMVAVAVPPTSNGVVMTAELDANVPPNTKLIVEVQASQGGWFFVGATNAGETQPGYLRAPACGRSNPVTMASIGFPNAHLLISVTGSQ